ncbi:hypothetical protein ACIO87_37930 [Streptomyces sp. NPDC087218]|uniref:hypothetical protein n=1 Tax=Streptomyces sp. NPDC087218 TaxID=3365769 RepID=UPI0037FB83ED
MAFHLDRDEHVVTVTVDRESKFNALDHPMIDALLASSTASTTTTGSGLWK